MHNKSSFLLLLYFFLFLFFPNHLFSNNLSAITIWLYQLQDIDLNAVAQTDSDLIVMDYSKDGIGQEDIYYADQSHSAANDTNPGTEAWPFKTIQAAIDHLEPGDKVRVKQGMYYESLRTQKDGIRTEQRFAPLIIETYPGHQVIVDGTDVNTSNTGFRIEHDYIHVSGILLQNWDTGIWIDQAGFTKIDSCTVRDVWYGIGAANGAHHFELNDVELYRFMLYGFDASPSGGDPCHHGVLNRCVAHTGADPEQNVDGFAFGHGNQYHFVLNHCTAYDVFDGFDISARNTKLNACEAYQCGWGGVKIWQDSVFLNNCVIYDNQVTNIELDRDSTQGTTQLVHCTIYNGGTWNINAYDNPSDQLMMYNCIVAGGDNVGMLIPESNYQGDYNLFHINNPPRMIGGEDREYALGDIDSGLWTEAAGQDSHSVVVYADTALFVDPEACDFHLKSNAPAIDQACAGLGLATDFDGEFRAGQGMRPDIGAYEYVKVTGIKKVKTKRLSSFRLEENFPDPFNHATCFRYQIYSQGNVLFRILNVKGQVVWKKKLENHSPGYYFFNWQGQSVNEHLLTSGVYILQMIHHESMQTRKLIMIR